MVPETAIPEGSVLTASPIENWIEMVLHPIGVTDHELDGDEHSQNYSERICCHRSLFVNVMPTSYYTAARASANLPPPPFGNFNSNFYSFAMTSETAGIGL